MKLQDWNQLCEGQGWDPWPSLPPGIRPGGLILEGDDVIIPPTATGCWLDCCRGHYIGEAVIDFAESLGFHVENEEDRTPEGEWYCEAWDDAEEYLQDFAAEGFFFGSAEDTGAWGYWSINPCPACGDLTIPLIMEEEYWACPYGHKFEDEEGRYPIQPEEEP